MALAVAAREELEAAGIGTRVVSMPSVDWFRRQSKAYQEKVLPSAVRARVSVEAGVPTGWREFVGEAGEIIGIDHFGASADAATLFREFGFTPAAVVSAARRSLKAVAAGTGVPIAPPSSAATDKPATRKPSRPRASAKGK